LVEVFLTLLLIAHLLCVNVAAGAPILCVWLEWRGDALARRVAAYLGRMGLVTLVAGGLFGLAIGWLKWSPAYCELWTGPLAYKLHWGAAELVFSLVLAVVYWLLVGGKGGTSAGSRIGRGLVALLNGTNLLYHFPPLFAVASKLYETGQTAGATIRGAQFRQLAWSGEAPALAIHVILASVAVAGVMLLGLALRWLHHDKPPADVARIATWGSRWALGASLVQLPVGLWTLMVLPAESQASLMGTQVMGTMLFLGAMLTMFWLLRELTGVALGEATRPAMIRSMTAMLVVVSLMTAMQQAVRPSSTPSKSTGAMVWPRKS